LGKLRKSDTADSEDQIEKLWGGNLLWAMDESQRIARGRQK
jgi:hypothetical protein